MGTQCRSIQRCLSDYIDHTLSARQTMTVAEHLRFCRDCQFELESLQRTKALLRVHTPPQPPEGYYNQFSEQLQRLIEKRPQPIWWGATALLQTMTWQFQEFLHRSISSFSRLVRLPIGWIKQSPVYAWMLIAVLLSMSAYQFFQAQEHNRFDAANLSQALKVEPTVSMEPTGNREVISNRERLIQIAQTPPEHGVRGEQDADQEIEVVESSADLLRWEGYQPNPVSNSGLTNNSDVFKAMPIHDVSPELMAVAQLSSPEPIAAKEDFSQPLGVVAIPASAEIGWNDNRSLNGVVEMLMNVPLPTFSITEVYDSVKL